ncbi:MAG TPA: hypothetical protein ENN51_07925, partial [candidate division WOR-3 bacterium]|nr:hypothetical protein [candidate division WOR-3 bacterium]
FLPELLVAEDAAELAALFDTEPLEDEDGVALVDENRLGTYVRFARPLPAAEYRRLHAGSDDRPAPVEAPDGRLFFNVTRHDAAAAEFEEIARRFSTSASRHSGGDLYWFDRDDPAKDKQVIDAAFRLNKGAISPVVKVNDSTWTFIKVEDKQAAYVRPLEEVSPKIEAGIRSRKAEEMRSQLLGDLRAAAEIKVEMTPEDFIFEAFEEDPPAPEDVPAGAVEEN